MAESSNNAFNNAYVSLKLNGMDSQISPMSFSIIEFDSIYQLYSKAKLVVSDYEGIINEYLGLVDGTSVEITIGEDESSAKSCKFVVDKNAVPQQTTSSNGIGGEVEVSLIHEYYAKQVKSSKAYQSDISAIVKNLVKKYEFNKVDIESTLNNGVWYQPYITDSEFIVNNMLPFAFSNTARKSPFFAFIDSNNVFHFKSFYSMFESTPLQTLTYTTQPIDIVANKETLSSINFSQLELYKIKPFLNCNNYNYDSDGNFNESTDKLSDYLNTQGKYPTITDIEDTTNVISLYDYDIKLDDTKNNNKGYLINLHKDVILPDKIIINTILNKDLVCGNTVNISVPMVDSNATSEESLKNSGKYLIESSYHIWNGTHPRTMLICSKQNLKLTNDYRNKHLLYS